MANKQRGFGLTAELSRKTAAKFDAVLANETLQWIEDVLMHGDLPDLAEQITSVNEQTAFATQLKDGVLLCNLINVIRPGSVKKVNIGKMAFKQMENIGNFLAGCEVLGCAKNDLFQTVDLYESNNIPGVINGINALARKARKSGFDGPNMGPEESTENKREFTEEQLRAGEAIIGLQAGSNKGASQAGQNFGKTRSIID